MKKVLLFAFLLLISTSLPALAADRQDEPIHQQQKAEQKALRDKYYKQAMNNEIYFLPGDKVSDYKQDYTYQIKEFKGGFQIGQRLIGRWGTENEYMLYVVKTTKDTVYALLERGDPSSVRRYDSLFIALKHYYEDDNE